LHRQFDCLVKPKAPHIPGAEREIVAEPKRAKHRKRPAKEMLPNLSGVKFEDALRALLHTPPPRDSKKPKN
jgi:hypothetical protein